MQMFNMNLIKVYHKCFTFPKICTNGGFCLCRVGRSGNACQIEISPDFSTALTTAHTDRVNSMNRNILANPTLLPPDGDIARYIWAQVDAMHRLDYKLGSQTDNGKYVLSLV